MPLFEELDEGDAAVFDPNGEKADFVGYIDFEDWKVS